MYKSGAGLRQSSVYIYMYINTHIYMYTYGGFNFVSVVTVHIKCALKPTQETFGRDVHHCIPVVMNIAAAPPHASGRGAPPHFDRFENLEEGAGGGRRRPTAAGKKLLRRWPMVISVNKDKIETAIYLYIIYVCLCTCVWTYRLYVENQIDVNHQITI